MSNSKRLVINISEKLCSEFDKALEGDCKKRSEFIREAIVLYIEEKKKLNQYEIMKRGYMEMSKINIEMSELGISSCLDELDQYEVMLSESDFPDDNDNSKKRRYILC